MTRTRERRPWKAVAGVVVAVAILVGAAELALRLIVPGIIAAEVRDQLALTDNHPVDVSLGGSALLHAVGGGVGDVTVDVPDAPIIEGVVADASVHADRVPFDPTSGEITGGTARLTVSKDHLGGVIEVLTQGIADSGSVRAGELAVGRELEVFGQTVDLSASIALSVADGDVEIEPRGVRAAGLDLSAEQLSAATGSLLDPILQPQTVCVAEYLPAGIELTGIELSSTGSASIDADLSPTILSDAAQREPGSCA